jgi:uncharacterized coiled-coil protein SlyX
LGLTSEDVRKTGHIIEDRKTYLEIIAAFEDALLNALDEVATEIQQSEASQAVELAARKDGVEVVA